MIVTEHRSPDGQTFTLRPCAGFAELDGCIALQQQTWGYPDLQVVPRNVFVLAQCLGGQVVGAWDAQGELAGFAIAFPAHQPARAPGGPPEPYLHSHMLAVAPVHRDLGLGRALKLWQRRDALRRGFTRMRWTFDPLVAKNACFNLRSLGATAATYLPDVYGPSPGGLPTDRLLAEWRLLDGESARETPENPFRIELPTSAEQNQAARVQASLRDQFTATFAMGLRATGFEPRGGGGGAYLLTPM